MCKSRLSKKENRRKNQRFSCSSMLVEEIPMYYIKLANMSDYTRRDKLPQSGIPYTIYISWKILESFSNRCNDSCVNDEFSRNILYVYIYDRSVLYSIKNLSLPQTNTNTREIAISMKKERVRQRKGQAEKEIEREREINNLV